MKKYINEILIFIFLVLTVLLVFVHEKVLKDETGRKFFNYSQELMFQNAGKLVNASNKEGSIYLRPGLSSFSPYTALQKGYYIVKIVGENLEYLTVDSYYNGGNDKLEKLSQSVESKEIDFIIRTNQYLDNYEVYIENTSDKTVRIDDIFVLPVDIKEIAYTEVLPESTNKIFLYNMEKIVLDWDFENYILKNNINLKDINQDELLNKINSLQSGSIIIMPKKSFISGYVNKEYHYYQLDDDKVVISPEPVKMSERLIKLDTEDINTLEYDYKFNGQNLQSGYDDAGVRYLEKDGVSFGPIIDINAGMYIVEFEGDNLNSAICKVTVNSGTKLVVPLAQSKDNHRVKYLVYFSNNVKHLETIVENKRNVEIVLNKITINRYFPKEINPPFELPENINKVVISSDRGLDFDDNIIGYIFLHNLKVENITEKSSIVKFFKRFDKNALFVLSKLASDDRMYNSFNQYYYTNNNILALHQTLNPDLRYVQKEKQKKTENKDKKAKKKSENSGVLYSFKYGSNLYLKKGKDENGKRYIYPSGQSYGPCIDIKKGNYLISVEGENLDKAKYKVMAEKAFVEIPIIYSSVESDKAYLFVSVNHDETYFEVNIENSSSSDIVLNSLDIKDIKYYNDRRIEGINKVISLDDRVEISKETAKFIVDNNLLYSFDKDDKSENLSSSLFLTNPDDILQYLKYQPYFYQLDYNLLFSINKIKNLKPVSEVTVYKFDDSDVFGLTKGKIEDGIKYIYKNGKSFGPNITLEKGLYRIDISGNNLENASYSLMSKSGKNQIGILSKDTSENKASLFFVLETTANDFEFVIENNGDSDIAVSDIKLNNILQYEGKNRTTVYIKRNDANKYYFTKAETDELVSEKADIKFNNLLEMPAFMRKLYLNSRGGNVEFIIPVGDYSFFEKNKIKKYVYSNKYLLLTNGERNDLWEYTPKVNKKYLFEENKFLNNGYDVEGIRHIKPSGQSFGPDITMKKGLYKSEITGKNLDKAEFSVKANNGLKTLSILSQSVNSETAEIYFLLEQKEKHYELIIDNKSKDEEVILTNIVTKPVKTDGESIVKIQVNDSDKYYFTNKEIEKFVSENAELKLVNLKAIPQYLRRFYLNLQGDNVSFIIPVMDCSDFIKFDINFFRFNDKYLLMQEDNNSDYPQFKIEKKKKYLFENNKFLNNGEDIEGVRYIKPSGQSFGPDITMQKGLYKSVITGENLNKAEFSVKSNNGKKSLSILSQSVTNDKAEIYFLLEKKEKHYELIIENLSKTEDVVLTNIETKPVVTDGYHIVKIQLNDANKYYFTNEEIEQFIKDNSKFEFINLNEMNKKFMKLYFKLQNEDVDVIVPVNKIENYKNNSLFIYEYNKYYYLMSKDNEKELKKYTISAKKKYLFENNMFLTNGEDIEGVRYIKPSGQSFGPDITMQKGLYKSVITGENLDKAEISVKSNNGKKSLSILSQDITSEKAEVYFLLENDEKHYELIIENKSKTDDIVLTNIDTKQVKTDKKQIVKIQLNDANKYYFTNEEIEKFVSEGSTFRFVNLDKIPQMFKKIYFDFQKENTEIVMPNFRQVDFEEAGKNFYVLGSRYVIETKGNRELPKYKDYVYKFEFKNNQSLRGGHDENGVRYLEPGGRSFGPNNTMQKGFYIIEAEGGNLENAIFTLTSNTGTKQIGILSKDIKDGRAVITFLLEETEKNFEFTTENNGDDEMSLSSIVIKKIDNPKPLKTVKIQVDDGNNYYFKNDEIEEFVSERAEFKFVNLNEIPQWFRKYYFLFQKNSTEIIMPEDRFADFENDGKNFYILSDKYIIETSGSLTLPKYKEYVYKFEFKDSQGITGGRDENGVRYIEPGGKSFGPDNTMQKGLYKTVIKGKNLNNALYGITSETGKKQIAILSQETNEDGAVITFLLEKTEKTFEFTLENIGSEDIIISDMGIKQIDILNPSKTVKIQSNDANEYHFSQEEIDKFIAENVQFKYVNLNKIPPFFMGIYLNLSSDSLFIINKDQVENFEYYKVNIENFNDSYSVMESYKAENKSKGYVYTSDFGDNENIVKGHDENKVRYLEAGGKSFGPDITLNKGLYQVEITGENLENSVYTITTDLGIKQIAILSQEIKDNMSVVTFLLEKTEKHFEFIVENKGNDELSLTQIAIRKISVNRPEKTVKIQYNDSNQYYFTNKEIEKFVSEKAKLEFVNLDVIPKRFVKYYFDFQKKNTQIIFPADRFEDYEQYPIKIEVFNKAYCIVTGKKAEEKQQKDYVYKYEFKDNRSLTDGYDENGIRYIKAGGRSFGPDITMHKGLYKVEIEGGNLENASYSINSNLGTKQIGILSKKTDGQKLVLTFLLENTEKHFEIIIENKGSDELSLSELIIKKVKNDKTLRTVKIQKSDENQYFFTEEEIDKFISEKARIKFVNIDSIPQWFRNYYFILQKRNTEIIIPAEKYPDYESYRVKIEEFDDSYYVITSKKVKKMPKDYVYKYEFRGSRNVSDGHDENEVRYISPGGRSFGPDITMHKGLYKVEIEGGNLENAVYSVTSDLGKKIIGILSQKTENNKTELLFLLDGTEKNFEFIVENGGDEEISLSEMVIKKIKFKKSPKNLNIQVNDENKYYFSPEETDKFISEKAQFRFVNLEKIPSWLLGSYFAVQRKKTEFIIPEKDIFRYEKQHINIYVLNDEYYVLTKDELQSLSKYIVSEEKTNDEIVFNGENFLNNGYDVDGVRHLNPSGQSFGPDITMPKGLYKVEIKGENLDKAEYTAMSQKGVKQLPVLSADVDSDKAIIYFLLRGNENNFEFMTENKSEDEEVIIKSIDIKEIPYDKTSTVKIQLEDNNHYYFSSKDVEHIIAQRADIKFVNLHELPKALYRLYFMLQNKNTEFVIPVKEGINYEKFNLNFYTLDGNYYVMTKGEVSTLPKYLLSDKIKRYSFNDEKFISNGYDVDGVRHLNPSGQSFGPDVTYEKGIYKAEIKGENLDKADYIVMSEKGSKQLPILSRETDSNKTDMYFLLEQRENSFELIIENKSENEEVILTDMVIKQEIDNSSLHKIKIQIDDDNKYYLSSEALKWIIDEDAEVKIINPALIPQKLFELYFRLQPKNCDFIIPEKDYSKYKEYKLNAYKLDERYLLLSNAKKDDLKEYKETEYKYIFGNNEFVYNGYDENGKRYINPDGQSTGPDITLEQGIYMVEITGENLQQGEYMLTSEYGNNNIVIVSKEISQNKALIYFILDKTENHIETIIKNVEEQGDIVLDKFVIRPMNRVNGNSVLRLADENLKKIVIAKDGDNNYYLTSKDMENGILKTNAKIEFVDFSKMSKLWLKYYFKFSGKNVVYFIPKAQQLEFSQYNLHCFEIDDEYVVMTQGICADLKQTESIKYEYIFNGNDTDGGEDIDGIRYLPLNASSFGPNISLGKGLYEVEIKGENLDELIYDAVDVTNKKAVKVLARFGDSEHKKIYVSVAKPINRFEVSLENPEETTAVIKHITIKYLPKYEIKPYSAMPYGINKIINYGTNLNNIDESFIRSIAYQNIEIEDSTEEEYVMDYISKHKNDTLLLIDSTERQNVQEVFLQNKLFFYPYQGIDFVSFHKLRLLHKYGVKPVQIPFEYNCKFNASSIPNGKDADGRRYLYVNGASSGPGIPLKKGYYEITIRGEKIDAAKINIYFASGTKEMVPYFAKCLDGEIVLLLDIKEDIDGIDIGIVNSYIERIIIDSVKIREISKSDYQHYPLQPYYYSVNEVIAANGHNDNLTFNLKQGSYYVDAIGYNIDSLKSNLSKDYYVNDFHVDDYNLSYNALYFSVNVNNDCQLNLQLQNNTDSDAGIYSIRITPKTEGN